MVSSNLPRCHKPNQTKNAAHNTPTMAPNMIVPGFPAADESSRDFDDLTKKVAELEQTYRDLGLRFFIFPSRDRAWYFVRDFEDVKKVFLFPGGEGEVSNVAKLLTSLRPLLEQIKSHLHQLRFQHIHNTQFDAVEKKLKEAHSVYDQANAVIRSLAGKMGSVQLHGRTRVISEFALEMRGAGLPLSEADNRWVDFKRWALTVREVQNLVALGEKEDAAVASLNIDLVQKEDGFEADGFVPELPSDDDYFSDSDDGSSADPYEDDASSVSNPYEDDYPEVNDGVDYAALSPDELREMRADMMQRRAAARRAEYERRN